MAQVEIIMYVALGFGVAALIALLLGRLLWSLAVAVGRRRALRTTPPPEVTELQAERNQLRAEYAMLARRVDVRLSDLKKQVAEHMSEVARSRNRVDRLGAEIESRDAMLAQRDSEIARLKDQVAALVADLESRTETLHKVEDDHGKANEEIAALRQQVAERDDYIERLRADVERLGAARSEAVSRERSVQERLKGRIEDLTALSRQIEAQRRELAAQQSESHALRESLAEQGPPPEAGEQAEEPVEPVEHRIEDAERQAGELQRELDRLDRLWAAKLDDVSQAVAGEPVTDATEHPLPAPVPAGVEGAAAVNGDSGNAVAAPAVEEPRGEAEQAQDGKKSAPGLANVISLAQRIRALQRNGS